MGVVDYIAALILLVLSVDVVYTVNHKTLTRYTVVAVTVELIVVLALIIYASKGGYSGTIG